MMLDLDFVRRQFPVFSDPKLGRWAHFENAGGSYMPHQVTDLMHDLIRYAKVQPYAPWEPSQSAGRAMDRSRERWAGVLGCAEGELHFGPSTTQNTYVLAQAIRPMLRKGDQIIVTDQDHEANIGAWRGLADFGVEVREWRVDPVHGLLDPAALDQLLSDRTRLVCVTHCSNIAATLNPVQEIARRAHDLDALLIVDGVSWAPHAMVDLATLGADVYLFSLYKTYGPHQGLMFTREALLERLSNQGHFFNAGRPTTKLVPAGPDHVEIGAASGVIDYYETLFEHHHGARTDLSISARMAAVFELAAAQEEALMTPLLDLLSSRDGVRVIGRPEPSRRLRAPTVAFHSARHSSAAIVAALTRAEIGCNRGHFYAYRLLQALGLDPDDGVVRLSLLHYNSLDEVHRACDVLDGLI